MTTTRPLDAATIAALRQLDPAGRGRGGAPLPLTSAERDRSGAVLERVLTADRSARGASGAATTGAARPLRGRRSWWLVALGAVGLVVALAVPGLVSGRDVAYASWTALPQPLSSAESPRAVDACLQAHGQAAPTSVEPLIAERRGGWAYVLVPLPGDVEASCIMPIDRLSAGKALRNGEWFGGFGERPRLTARPRHIEELIAGRGSTEEGLLSYTEGAVGRDVAAVTFTTPRGVEVVASVANGRYAAWWPAGESKITNPEISGAPLVDLTLRDGTTVREPPR